MSNTNLQQNKDTVHIIVKSPYILIIEKNTNPTNLEIRLNTATRTVTIHNKKSNNSVLDTILETDQHHYNGDQFVLENDDVRLIIEYQMIYIS